MRLARIWLARVRLTRVWLLPGTCPALAGNRACRLPGARVPAALTELPLVKLILTELPLALRPAGSWSLLRPGGLPRARVAGAVPARSRSRYPALPLLRSRAPPRAVVPRVGAEPGAGRCLPCGPVRPLRRIRGLPGPGVPRVRAGRSLAGRPAGSLLRSGALPQSGVRRVLVELPVHLLRAAGLSGAVRVGVAVRAGDIRHLTGRLAVRPGRGCLARTERSRTERSLAGRPRPLSRPELAGSLRSGGELTLPVAGWPLPGLPLPVPGLAGRPRLSLPVATLPCLRSLPGTWPARTMLARTVLARPGRLRRVLAGPALTLLRWHGSRVAGSSRGPVSRWRPAASRSRRPPGRRPVVRRALSALCLSREGLGPPGEVLSLIPGLPGIPGHLRPRGAAGRARAWPGRVSVRTRPLRVVEPGRARPARWRRALLARTRLARGSLPRAGTGRSWPWAANTRHRVLGALPGRSRVVHRLPARTWRVTRPGRRAALRPGARRPRGRVRGAGPVTFPAARVVPVAGVNGIGVSFEVRVPLVSVPFRVGSVAGPAVRASVRPAALTIHPAPPGHTVRRSPPQIECRAARAPGYSRRVIARGSILFYFVGQQPARVSDACG
ncbi:MAG: hypothetical protein QOG28_876 [Trebonia sp.]|nr:hypothetical protein [Trebonia sp.]